MNEAKFRVYVEYDDEDIDAPKKHIVVVAPDLVSWGSGRTIAEACADLANAIEDIRAATQIPDDQLAPDMIKLKRLFEGWSKLS